MRPKPNLLTTIFLRQPVGVAIHTDSFATGAEVLKAVREAWLGEGLLVVASDKADMVIIPVENIASVEVQ